MTAFKLLVAVKSCLADADRGLHQAIENSWMRGFAGKADVKFFTGDDGRQQVPNQVMLKVDDSYNALPQKTKQICRWMLGKIYSHVLLCDTDTALMPSKVLTCGFESYDYVGKIDRSLSETFPYTATTREGNVEFHPRTFGWASGGFGYILSRRAAVLVEDMNIISHAEDLCVGQVLGPEIALGNMTALSLPPLSYSQHYDLHGESYDNQRLIDWQARMYKERP